MMPHQPRCTLLTAWFLPALAAVAAASTYEPIAAFELGPISPDRAALLRHVDGNLYGVSRDSGAEGAGTIYRLDLAGQLSTLTNFSPNEAGSKSGLTRDGRGYFWGTTFSGGSARRGSIYKVDPGTRQIITVHEFALPEAARQGLYPAAALTRDAAAFLGDDQSRGCCRGGIGEGRGSS